MKWLFSKILGFVLLFAWPIVALYRAISRGKEVGRQPETKTTDSLPSKRRAVDDIEFLEPEPVHETWLDRVEYVTLYVYERRYNLIVVLPDAKTKNDFHDLRMVVFPKGEQQREGIECGVDKLGEIRIYSNKYILPLSPTSEWDTHAYAKRITWRDHRAYNIARVVLWLGDKSRNFAPQKDVFVFYPEKEAAA
ncbi:hypothetical protein HZB93_03125 [Candidatus Falkowbacteria bacterium]|nr:hypothetical protein [Candidatus Falkowbacteria bacterium]